ncbi:MAG TPA: tetratricopeptide repeat protein, partial [Turneriella sp.]|nr:tetratricopeptide repeat protein [Turneriella sp.]
MKKNMLSHRYKILQLKSYFIVGCISVLVLFFVTTSFASPSSPQYYYDEAVKFMKSGDTIRASDMARESLRRNGDYVPSLLLLAQILNDSLEIKSAQQLVSRALSLDNDNEKAALLCARIELKLNNREQFENCLQIAQKKKKLNPDAESLYAQVLINNAQYGIAKRKIDAILRDNPGHTETRVRLAGLYLKLKQFQKAEEEFRKIQALIPENNELAVAIARARIDAFFKDSPNGIFSAESDTALRALEALRHAYSNNNDNLSVNLMLAQLLAVTGKCSDADSFLSKLIQSEKEMRSVVIFYALCNPTQGQRYLINYLRRNEDDDLTRHQEELLQLSLNKKRENPIATQAARYHFQIARRAMKENADMFALASLRWTQFLFPAY